MDNSSSILIAQNKHLNPGIFFNLSEWGTHCDYRRTDYEEADIPFVREEHGTIDQVMWSSGNDVKRANDE